MTKSTTPRAHGVLKIGILCHPTYGGSGVVASELALTLAERGHKVHLFSHAVPPRLAHVNGSAANNTGSAANNTGSAPNNTGSAPNNTVEMHVAQGFPYPLFHSTPHDLAITSTILNIHRESGIDVLHAHYALPHAVSAYLARSAAIADRGRRAPKIVTTLHGTDITLVGNDPSYAPLTQFVIEQSDAVTAVSENLAQRTRENFCREPLKTCAIEVIPNGVDTEQFHPSRGEGREPAAPLAVHVSNFRPVKRVPWLIEAFARATANTNAKLLLVGDGPDQYAARAKAQELGIEARVEFLGERDHLPEILAPADVFLLSSSDESFGLSALEAMSSGTPVVSTAVGGVGEVVESGVNGLLSAADDLDAFAANMKSLLFDRRRAKAMGAAARRTAETRFARGTIVQRYEDVYMRLLQDSAWPFP